MPQIDFDPDGHVYRIDGAIWSSVTQDLESCGLTCFDMVPEETLERAKIRGRAVHAASRYVDENDLDWSTVKEEYLGYVRGYEKFKAESGFKPQRIEQIVYDETFGIVGTLDREGEEIDRDWLKFRGAPSPEAWEAFLIDLKTGIVTPGVALQLAGYDFCLPKKNRLRIAIKLNADGSYRPHFYYAPSDKYTYLACHSVVQWKMRNLA